MVELFAIRVGGASRGHGHAGEFREPEHRYGLEVRTDETTIEVRGTTGEVTGGTKA
jgi:hypothetical protein